jgi:hypothetical protein
MISRIGLEWWEVLGRLLELNHQRWEEEQFHLGAPYK